MCAQRAQQPGFGYRRGLRGYGGPGDFGPDGVQDVSLRLVSSRQLQGEMKEGKGCGGDETRREAVRGKADAKCRS